MRSASSASAGASASVSAQVAELERAADDLAMSLRGEDPALVAVVQLCVEERRRLPRRTGARGGVVGDRGRDPTQQEAGLAGAELDVRALAVGMGGGRLAEDARHPFLARVIHQVALGAGEQVLPARRRHRHRLAAVADRVVGLAEAHPLVAEQLAAGGLGDAGDIGPGRQARADLIGVVDPGQVVAVAVGNPDRLAQAPALVRLQEPELRVDPSLGRPHGLYIRPIARLAQP